MLTVDVSFALLFILSGSLWKHISILVLCITRN